MRTLLPAVLTVALVACNAYNITAVSNPVTSVATDVWAGGSVKLHSHAFTSSDSLPLVLLAGDTLPVSLADTFIVSVELPDTVSGPLVLSVLSAAASDTQTVTVNAHGFVRAYGGPKLAGLPQRTPDGFMLARGTGGTVLVNPAAGVAQPLVSRDGGGTGCGALTPGLSLVAGVVVSSGPDCKYYAWRFDSGPVAVDSAPATSAWALAYLGPNRWLMNSHHTTLTMTDTSWTELARLESPNEYVADPAGHFVVPAMVGGVDPEGSPVYSTSTSTIAYHIAGQGEVGGAGFSSDGDTLFVAGVHWVGGGGPVRFLVLDAATGKILREGPLDGYGGGYMIVEPNRPWIYTMSDGRIPINGSTRGTVGVEVIDRRTLATVAHMEVPASAPQPFVWYDVLCPVLGANNKLYVVDVTAWDGAPEPTRIYEFDLLP